MKQTKLMSMLETVLSTAAGFGIALLAQIYFLPWLGVTIAFHQNLKFAVIMTVISLARQFILRRIFEALHIRRPLSAFVRAVIAERFRQIEAEGWDAAHDDEHVGGELALAGAAYAIGEHRALLYLEDDAGKRDPVRTIPFTGRMVWPWSRGWWKPDGDRRNLVKSAALIIAEGEKFDRSRKARAAA